MDTAVRILRKRLGLSQAQLGKELGCTRAWISKCELGEGTLHWKKVKRLEQRHGRLMKQLGITGDDILMGRRLRRAA